MEHGKVEFPEEQMKFHQMILIASRRRKKFKALKAQKGTQKFEQQKRLKNQKTITLSKW